MDFLQNTVYQNSILTWITALAVSALCYGALRLLFWGLRTRLGTLAAKTDTQFDDGVTKVLANTKLFFLLIVALSIGSLTLDLSATVRSFLTTLLILSSLVQAGFWASTALTFALEIYTKSKVDPAGATTLNALGFVSRLVLWSGVLLLGLDNIGIDVTALIAGLGVGGIAVALAVQNILGDLFASLTIVLDKPFVIGDFLIVGDMLGSVEYVGLKTTRLRSLSGEQLVFSNADLLGSRIRNYGRMFERRVVFSLGVTYQTPRDKLQIIPTIVRESIEQEEKTRFDRAHFKQFGAYSLDFEAVYYVLGPEYNLYMDIQQAINLRIHERFEKEGIEFAYPSQTLFLVKEDTVDATGSMN